MPKKECRYDKSHKFNTEEEQLEHEAKYPTKKKRTDLKECPYSNRHILTIKQYERHIKNCKFKPKMVKKEVNKNDDNSNSNTNKEKGDINSEFKWNESNEFWGDEKDVNCENSNPNQVKEPKNFNFDYKNEGDVFENEDFIFSQCYVQTDYIKEKQKYFIK